MRRKRNSFISQYLFTHIQNNILQYFCLATIFVISIIIGVIVFNMSSDQQKHENMQVIEKYINTNENINSVSRTDIFKKSIQKNLFFAITMFIFSASFIGIIVIYFNIVILRFWTRIYNIYYLLS